MSCRGVCVCVGSGFICWGGNAEVWFREGTKWGKTLGWKCDDVSRNQHTPPQQTNSHHDNDEDGDAYAHSCVCKCKDTCTYTYMCKYTPAHTQMMKFREVWLSGLLIVFVFQLANYSSLSHLTLLSPFLLPLSFIFLLSVTKAPSSHSLQLIHHHHHQPTYIIVLNSIFLSQLLISSARTKELYLNLRVRCSETT